MMHTPRECSMHKIEIKQSCMALSFHPGMQHALTKGDGSSPRVCAGHEEDGNSPRPLTLRGPGTQGWALGSLAFRCRPTCSFNHGPVPGVQLRDLAVQVQDCGGRTCSWRSGARPSCSGAGSCHPGGHGTCVHGAWVHRHCSITLVGMVQRSGGQRCNHPDRHDSHFCEQELCAVSNIFGAEKWMSMPMHAATGRHSCSGEDVLLPRHAHARACAQSHASPSKELVLFTLTNRVDGNVHWT
eukprot:scaffold195950_cov20-Tisochrysis_lutea.AAC.3